MSRRLERTAWAVLAAVTFAAGHVAAAAPTTITLQPGESITIVAATPAPPSPTPTASPTPAAATPTPAPTPTPTQGPSTPPPTSAPCGGTALQARVDAAAAGSTLDLGTCVYTAGATVSKSLTLKGGTIRQGGTALNITGNDVTVDGMRFEGGAQTVIVQRADRVRIANSVFVNMTETSIRLNGPGADDVTIENNTITQTVKTAHGYSPIGHNDNSPGGPSARLTVRHNTIDQGPSGVAWFGVEVWAISGLLIEDNTFVGAGPGCSIPRSDGAVIRGNTFDMTLNGWAGCEIADVDGAQFLNNIGFATGTVDMSKAWRALVQLHPGSGSVNNTTITGNKLTNYPALVNAPPPPGSGTVVTDNCLNNVGRLNWGTFPLPVTIARNGACP